MCIVIDTNVLSSVFNESNTKHKEFAPVKQWIDSKLGFVVYGGTKYKRELAETRYVKLIRLLKDAGQAIAICDDIVDQLEVSVRAKTVGTDCDDPHIIALLGASKCTLLCSLDGRSFGFIKDKKLYPKKSPAVKIYCSSRNKSLLKKTDPTLLKNFEDCPAIAACSIRQ